jgi:3-hydroxybutyryl-CoA dehydrogenase
MTKVPCGKWLREGVGARMEVKTIAVIGAGDVGRGIAYVAARGGYATILEDLAGPRLEKAMTWIRQCFEQSAAGGTREAIIAARAAAANVTVARAVEDAIRDADLIIETLPDEMELQIELFTILDKFSKPNAIFATTGSISITELAEVTFCADRCVGMRFSGRAAESQTVELAKGSQTSAETIAACSEVARRMGKAVVMVSEPDREKSDERERKFADAQD